MIDSDPRKARAEARFKASKEFLDGTPEKLCTSCQKLQTIDNFTTCKIKNVIRLKSWCRTCTKIRSAEDYLRLQREGPLARDEHGYALILVNRASGQHMRRARSGKKGKRSRTNPVDWPYFLRISMRSADKERGRQFNLSDDDIAAMVVGKACTYCGCSYARMTLDRIDNSLGHIYGNVVVSCGFCNAFRSDLPYDVWMALVPALKAQIQQGKLAGYLTTKAANKAFMAESLAA